MVRFASYASHATDFSLSCLLIQLRLLIRVIDNAYMRCVLMTSYGMRAMRMLRVCGRVPLSRNRTATLYDYAKLLRRRTTLQRYAVEPMS
uniref:SFRICE_008964 n=1 Tax=Spodoptera frugiperda TaxID=7108 RepID=A0A2H1VGR1_SPOFR